MRSKRNIQLDLNDREMELFEEFQSFIPYLVSKFGGKEKKKGIEIEDVYQEAKMRLARIIKTSSRYEIDNWNNYLFKAVYREIRDYLETPFTFVDIESVYEGEWLKDVSNDPEENLIGKEVWDTMLVQIDKLEDRRKYVIESLYGLNGREIKSLAAIGREFGVTYQMISFLHRSGLKKIRNGVSLKFLT